MESSKDQEYTKMEEKWKVYQNPLYSDLALCTELEEAKAEIAELKAELELERGAQVKMERLSEEERARREAVDRVNEELGIREAEVCRIRREIDEEKKMMRVAEVFREGYNSHISPVSVLRRSASPEPENPHIRRGIRGSVEFQRAVKAMCTLNKSSKQLGQNKLQCQKAQLKILLKQRIPVRPSNSYFIS